MNRSIVGASLASLCVCTTLATAVYAGYCAKPGLGENRNRYTSGRSFTYYDPATPGICVGSWPWDCCKSTEIDQKMRQVQFETTGCTGEIISDSGWFEQGKSTKSTSEC